MTNYGTGSINVKGSFDDFKDITNSIKSLFKPQALFDDSDTQLISDYNREVELMIKNIGGLSANTDKQAIKQAAMNKTMEKASDGAKKYINETADLTVNLNEATKASKAAEFGMKALASVGRGPDEPRPFALIKPNIIYSILSGI